MTHSISFGGFERFLLSGGLSHHGADAEGHSLKLKSQVYTNQAGATSATVPSTLPVGGHVERVWAGYKPGNYARLGFDHFDHHENVSKVAAKRLMVQDAMVFHDGRTIMERTYTASSAGPQQLRREVGGWNLDLSGMRGMGRAVQFVARPAMLRQLGRVEQTLANILQAEGIRLKEVGPVAHPVDADEAA